MLVTINIYFLGLYKHLAPLFLKEGSSFLVYFEKQLAEVKQLALAAIFLAALSKATESKGLGNFSSSEICGFAFAALAGMTLQIIFLPFLAAFPAFLAALVLSETLEGIFVNSLCSTEGN